MCISRSVLAHMPGNKDVNDDSYFEGVLTNQTSSKRKAHVCAQHCSWWNQQRRYPWKWQQWIPPGWGLRKGDWKCTESGRTIPAWLAGGHSWQIVYEASFFISKKKISLVVWANLKGLGRELLKALCREQNWSCPSRCCNAAEPSKMDNGGGRGAMPENLTHQAPCHLQALHFCQYFLSFFFSVVFFCHD